MATNPPSICSGTPPESPSFAEHHLDHTQQKEEFLVEQYTQVLEALEDQYARISKLLADIKKDSFEEKALGELLESIREAMRMNDVGMTETRRELWKRFWEEDGAASAEDGDGGDERKGSGDVSGDVE